MHIMNCIADFERKYNSLIGLVVVLMNRGFGSSRSK